MSLLLTLIRRQGVTPIYWLLSQACAIPKFNNKTGTDALRLLHMLDPLGKCWVSGIWRQQKFNLPSWAFGFVPKRAREEAAITLRALSHRLLHAGYGILWLLYDVKNAFPSVAWESISGRPLRDF